jgi:hypothetical protein
MSSVHPWKFVFCGIDLVGARLENALKIYGSLQREYFQDLLISSGYFDGALFTWIGFIIHYGLKNDIKPHFKGISKKYSSLEIVKELDMRILLTADENDADMLTDFFKIAALDSLLDAGKKYKLSPNAIEILKEERSKLGQIPDWKYEMEKHPEIMLNMYQNSIPSQIEK